MLPGEKKRDDLYKWIKIGGLLSFIPFILVAGPLAGYFFGNYLEKRFNSPPYVSLILIVIGFASGVQETIRIIRIALKSEKH